MPSAKYVTTLIVHLDAVNKEAMAKTRGQSGWGRGGGVEGEAGEGGRGSQDSETLPQATPTAWTT